MDRRSVALLLAGDPTLKYRCRSKDHVAEIPAKPLSELTFSSHRNIKLTATFTLPHELNPLAQAKPGLVYGLLFKAASRTLLEFGRNPRWLGGEIGITMVLHTWGQNLGQHVHVHCIVTDGGLSRTGKGGSPRRATASCSPSGPFRRSFGESTWTSSPQPAARAGCIAILPTTITTSNA